jgi:hypothetical protein
MLAVVARFGVNAARGAGEARPVAWHPPGVEDVKVLLGTLGIWTIGERRNHDVLYEASALVFAAVLLAAWLLLTRRATGTTPETQLDGSSPTASPARIGVALGAFALTQMLVLLATSWLLDNDVSFDLRLMLPAELAIGILVIGALAARPPVVFSVLVMTVCLFARLHLSTGPFPQGLAVPHPPTYDPIFDALAPYPADTVIATSVPEVVWGTTGRASIFSPAEYDTLSGRKTADLDDKLRELGRLVGARGGLLLLQRVESPRLTRPSDVARVLPCAHVVDENGSALLYDLAPCAP